MNEGEIPVFFKEKKNPDEKSEKISLKVKQFIENNPVKFSESEEEKLINEYEKLESQGLHGIIHVIHQGSSTAGMIKRELPPRFKEKYYHRVHILRTEDLETQSHFVEKGDMVVSISRDGTINAENQKILDNALRDRVGIMAGGGAGSPKDPIYQPLLKALEKEIQRGTPGLGICLGHQLFGELIMNIREKVTKGVVGGYFEGPISREKVTNEGKKHSVFERFGDGFNTGSWNQFHLVVPEEVAREKDVFNQGRVLTRSEATNYPTSLELRGAKERQLITIQRHPEFRIKDAGQDYEAKILNFSDGSELILPPGSSPDLIKWAKDMVSEPDFSDFNLKYGITQEDIRKIFSKDIPTKNLGKDFYGPMLDYMARFRLSS